jgi:hypothetical protein
MGWRNYEKKSVRVLTPLEMSVNHYKGRSQFRVLAFLSILINSTRKALQPSRISNEYYIISGRK